MPGHVDQSVTYYVKLSHAGYNMPCDMRPPEKSLCASHCHALTIPPLSAQLV